MSEFVSQIMQKTPQDVEICELTARVTDDGIEVVAKSEILGKFIKARNAGSYKGTEFGRRGWDKFTCYQLPGRIGGTIPGYNMYSTDMFVPARQRFPGDNLRNAYDPNLIWMLVDGLEEGITVVFPQPAHVPADIIDYLTRSMDFVRTFYTRYVQPFEARATLTERK